MQTVQFLRGPGNWARIVPANVPGPDPQAAADHLYRTLERAFTYTHVEHLNGLAARQAAATNQPAVVTYPVPVHFYDHEGYLNLLLGSVDRGMEAARAIGWAAEYIDTGRTPREAKIFDNPRIDRVRVDGGLRNRQDEFLGKLFANERGIFDCSPGYGKSFLMVRGCESYPEASILVVAPSLPILNRVLYPDLLTAFPGVGKVGGGGKHVEARVVASSAQSLHLLAHRYWDLVLVDECHRARGNQFFDQLSALKGRPRLFGFSGTIQDIKGPGMRVEALFGKILMRVGYREQQAAGYTPGIEIYWRKPPVLGDPAAGLTDLSTRKRHGIWRNKPRNAAIVEDARRYAGKQVLVACETLEHVVHLKGMCPEAKLIYAPGGASKLHPRSQRPFFEHWHAKGVADLSDSPPLDAAMANDLVGRMEGGEPGIYIATPVLNTGVNLKHLAAVCVASGIASPEMSVQLAGRLLRGRDIKAVGYMHEYADSWNSKFLAATKERISAYAGEGYTQKFAADCMYLGTRFPFTEVWQ